MQNTRAGEQTGVSDQWKIKYRPPQNSVGQGTRGKNRSVSRTGPALSRWGNWTRGPIPTWGQLSESEEKHLRLGVKQLTYVSLKEWASHSPCCSHTYPGQGCRSPGRHSSQELEIRDCGAIPGRGLLLTAERQIEGVWGRRLWCETPVEQSRGQPRKQGDAAESGVGGGEAITIALLSPQASICSWTTEEVAHQRPDARNTELDPSGRPVKCLTGWSTE